MNQDFYLYRHAWRYNLAPDAEPELSDAECRELLSKGGWMVRNTYDYDCQEETNFWYVVKDQFGGLEELSSNERNKLRHAFQSFEYRLIDRETVRQKAYPIQGPAGLPERHAPLQRLQADGRSTGDRTPRGVSAPAQTAEAHRKREVLDEKHNHPLGGHDNENEKSKASLKKYKPCALLIKSS